MPGISSSILPASALLTDFDIANYSMPSAGTRYQVDIPLGSKQFSLKAKIPALLKLFKTNIATASYDLDMGENYEASSIKGSVIITFWIESNKASQIIQVIYWT